MDRSMLSLIDNLLGLVRLWAFIKFSLTAIISAEQEEKREEGGHDGNLDKREGTERHRELLWEV